MNYSDHEDIFAALGQRGGIEDNRYFVGRNDVMMRFVSCTRGEKRDPVWIYGARRIGKSSLAKELARKARENATTAIWVDASTIDNFEDLLSRSVERFTEEVFTKSSVTERFEEFARYSEKQPILLVFDEFDRVAVNLGTSEQGFLRRLSEENRYFTYIFITRLYPGLVIQELPDMNSRLSGICNHGEIASLKESDIRELCARVFKDIGQECPESLSYLIWCHVGGLPVAVMTILRDITLASLSESLEYNDILGLLDQGKDQIVDYLKSYWWDLRHVTRQFLIGDYGIEWAENNDVVAQLQHDGIIHRRKHINKPIWLVEFGKKAGLIRDAVSSTDNHNENTVARIHDLIANINDAAILIHGTAPFKTGHEILKYHHLTRPVCDEETFKESIDHLYKVFFESASQKNKNLREWRFAPESLAEQYSKSVVIGDISDLRNFFRHNHTRETDSDKRNNSYKEAASIFERLCGVKLPSTNKHRRDILDCLLMQIVNLLELTLGSYRARDCSSNAADASTKATALI